MHVLNIGAGTGLYSCCVSALGAERLIALEPELKGSVDNAITKFRHRLDDLNLENIEFHPISIQEYTSSDESFDLIYMLASINHMDEVHAQTLSSNEDSCTVCRNLLEPLYHWIKPSGTLIISDASPVHVFTPFVKLGLLCKHPFQPDIEWNKHQPPKE